MNATEDRREPVLDVEGAPPPGGAYSPGIRAGDLLFCSGQLPFDESGTLQRGSVADQVRFCLDNLDRVARAAGGRVEHAVRAGVYLRDLADFSEMDAAYRERLSRSPARVTAGNGGFNGFAARSGQARRGRRSR